MIQQQFVIHDNTLIFFRAPTWPAVHRRTKENRPEQQADQRSPGLPSVIWMKPPTVTVTRVVVSSVVSVACSESELLNLDECFAGFIAYA